ncbi:hypothetical protein [Streptomyces sp. NPDC020996]|uniref:hypothetical protein n=1 Tax=Streptomyces sp. NPDC020996 TaxID=3154791 RepID=UPI00340379E3
MGDGRGELRVGVREVRSGGRQLDGDVGFHPAVLQARSDTGEVVAELRLGGEGAVDETVPGPGGDGASPGAGADQRPQAAGARLEVVRVEAVSDDAEQVAGAAGLHQVPGADLVEATAQRGDAELDLAPGGGGRLGEEDRLTFFRSHFQPHNQGSLSDERLRSR